MHNNPRANCILYCFTAVWALTWDRGEEPWPGAPHHIRSSATTEQNKIVKVTQKLRWLQSWSPKNTRPGAPNHIRSSATTEQYKIAKIAQKSSAGYRTGRQKHWSGSPFHPLLQRFHLLFRMLFPWYCYQFVYLKRCCEEITFDTGDAIARSCNFLPRGLILKIFIFRILYILVPKCSIHLVLIYNYNLVERNNTSLCFFSVFKIAPL